MCLLGYAVFIISHDESRTSAILIVGALSFAIGLALIAGFLTPLAGTLGTLTGIAGAFFLLPVGALSRTLVQPVAILTGVISLALSLLGPGAFSVDSRLFGRREIVIPRPSRLRK